MNGPAPGDDLPPGLVPDHQLLRCIGRGSYGEVWLARSLMGVYRAIKIIHRKSFKDERPFEREYAGIQKFEPLSRSHEGFVDVLHVGGNAAHDCFFYVMELGDDQNSGQDIDPETYLPKTLAKELAVRGRLPLAECRQLAVSLSDALWQLHKHGLVHRDIKPANIIFVNGAPKLADIGLVAHVHEARSYVGTEGYIPPEGPGTPQADIYSLGKVLYEISTGKDRHEFPGLPDDLKQYPDREEFLEFNEIVLQAARNDLSKRYSSARKMHGELLVLESGKSIRRLHWLEHQLAVGKRLGAAALAVLAVGAVFLYHQLQERKQQEQAAQIRQRQVGASVAYGTTAAEAGDLLGALPSFVEALRLEQGDAKHEENHRLRIASVLRPSPKLLQLWNESGMMTHAEFGPDGRQVVMTARNGKAQIRDAQSGQPIAPPFGPAQGLQVASFSPDGRIVVTASIDKTISLWDARTGEENLKIRDSAMVLGVGFSPDGSRVVSAGKDGVARVWDSRTGEKLSELRGHTETINHAVYSKDGRTIVTASNDRTARIWDAASGRQKGAPLEHRNWVYSAAFSPDGRWVVTACYDRKARMWNVQSGQLVLPVMAHGDAVRSAEFSPDGRFIITAGWDSTARLWDAETRQPVNPDPVLYHSSRLMHGTFHPAGHQILTACIDGTIRIWDMASSVQSPTVVHDRFSRDGGRFLAIGDRSVQVLDARASNAVSAPIPINSLHTAALSPNGRFVLTLSLPTATANGKQRDLQVYDSQTAKPIFPALTCSGSLTNLRISENGRYLADLGGSMATIYEFTGAALRSNTLSICHPISGAEFSRDGSRLLAAGGSAVEVWDIAAGRLAIPRLTQRSEVSHVAFSPEGNLFVICTRDLNLTEHAAQIRDASTGKVAGKPLWHTDGLHHAAFSPDGRRIVTSGEDFKAIVWETASGKRLTPLNKLVHDDQVVEAAFSPDGRWIVTASRDGTARVWDADTGEPLMPPLRHPCGVLQARFVAGNSRVITHGVNGESWLWNLPRDDRPLEDLTLLARLLCREQGGPSGSETPARPAPLRSLWQALKSRYPSSFEVSVDEVEAWRRNAVETSCNNRQWSAALFHLDRLLVAHPEDKALTKIREEIQRNQLTENRGPD